MYVLILLGFFLKIYLNLKKISLKIVFLFKSKKFNTDRAFTFQQRFFFQYWTKNKLCFVFNNFKYLFYFLSS